MPFFCNISELAVCILAFQSSNDVIYKYLIYNPNLLGNGVRADLGGGCRGCAPPPPEMTCSFLIQLVFCEKKTMWFIGAEVEQETSAPPPEKKAWIRPCGGLCIP